MQFKYRRAFFVSLLLVLSLGSQFSCKDMKASDPVEDLKQRAAEYWNLRIQGQFESAYAYELPEAIKDVPLSQYLESIGRGVQWLGAEPESASVDNDKGSVTMKIRYRWTFTQDQPPEGLIGRYSEKWQLYDGKWYHVYTGRRGTKAEKVTPKSVVPGETGQPKASESSGKPEVSQAPQPEADTGVKDTNPSVSSQKPEEQEEGSKKP